ncbi:MAG TPA: MBL fold metallo-hydrolase, partial [Acidimicrobiales bacterium]|nr:MBL fold metallo-hydrolase [Acidimicrobiales bacterium]
MSGGAHGPGGFPAGDGLRLTVLGCSGSYPGPGQACSGYLVRHGATTVWLDAGSGTLANLQLHVALGEIDAIVLSHEHPDHWSDVEGFAVASHHIHHLPPVRLLAPAALRDRVMMSHRAFEWIDI